MDLEAGLSTKKTQKIITEGNNIKNQKKPKQKKSFQIKIECYKILFECARPGKQTRFAPTLICLVDKKTLPALSDMCVNPLA